jgi:hypothetical protein
MIAMSRRALPSVLLFAGVAVAASVATTWAVADVLYDIGLPRCASGRRTVSCGGEQGWHGVSSLISALVTAPLLFALVSAYLLLASRLVRAEKAKRRDERRSALRRQFALVLLVAIMVTVPATMAVRSTL